jgi:hypothetical protein
LVALSVVGPTKAGQRLGEKIAGLWAGRKRLGAPR